MYRRIVILIIFGVVWSGYEFYQQQSTAAQSTQNSVSQKIVKGKNRSIKELAQKSLVVSTPKISELPKISHESTSSEQGVELPQSCQDSEALNEISGKTASDLVNNTVGSSITEKCLEELGAPVQCFSVESD